MFSPWSGNQVATLPDHIVKALHPSPGKDQAYMDCNLGHVVPDYPQNITNLPPPSKSARLTINLPRAQKAELLKDKSVVAYLGSMEPAENEQVAADLANEDDDEFS